jgi:hypothetical protein
MRRVNLEVDRLPIDAFIAASYARRLCLDFAFYFLKVVPSPTRNMMELGPFLLRRNARRCVWNLGFSLLVIVAWNIDELKDEWPSSHDAAASWQKISTNNILEDGRLARRLGADNDLFVTY